MLHVQVVKGPPTEVQYFDPEDLANRLTDHDVDVIREIFRTPLTGSYNWDYEAANARIRRLYELGKRFNWNSELDVDWTLPERDRELPPGAGPEGFVQHPKWQALSAEQKAEFMRRANAQTLSQFLHGEQGALMVASQLVTCAPTHDAKLYAASQTFDEARHVEVFGFTRDEALEINARSQGGEAFRTFLFERMIPNLKRVGLLTDAIRPKFEELGVLSFESLKHDGEIDWVRLEAPLEIGGRMVS